MGKSKGSRITSKGTKNFSRASKINHYPIKVNNATIPINFADGSHRKTRGCACGWLTITPDEEAAKKAFIDHLNEVRGK